MDRMERNQRIFDLGEALDKANEALLELNALGHKMSNGTVMVCFAISKWQQTEGPPDKKWKNVDRRDLRAGKKLRRQAELFLREAALEMHRVQEAVNDAIEELRSRN